jgi:hypothetical protein
MGKVEVEGIRQGKDRQENLKVVFITPKNTLCSQWRATEGHPHY